MSVKFVSGFLSWAACALASRFTSRKAILCVGSEETCDRNTCCPGYSESNGQTFPCINADESFDECEVNIKYGVYNASLLDFSNVVYDNLSDETDGSGEALIGGAAWWGGQRVDLLIQYVDEQDNVVPVQGKVFQALKPEETGYLLRFDFAKMSRGRFRFNYGQWENAVWRPFEMPWASVTLMDIDCGRKTSRDEDCEVITSADHSTYEAGDNVAVTSGEDGAVSFKDTIVSGGENNPDSIILNREQQALAVALNFQDADHFTLDMRNDAPWPRTFLVAGITNIQWPRINPPPIKWIPERVPPTPWPTPAPVPPTPSPTATCSFTAVSGSCAVNCTCMSSSNYPQNYAANDACVIGLAGPTPLITKDFSTEAFWDALEVNNESFSGSNGPDGLVAEGTISWKADKQDQEKGWQICAGKLETVPTPAPPTSSPTVTVQTTELCELSGALCVQSPNYPLNYGNYQTCSIRLPPGTLHVDEFFTEKRHDTLTVDGVSFSGQTGPDRVNVSASTVIVWSSDWGTTHKGWRVCAELPSAPTPAPTEELLYRPRSVPLTLSRVTSEHPMLLMLTGITGIVGGSVILGCVFCGGIVSHAEEDASSSDDPLERNDWQRVPFVGTRALTFGT